MVLCVPALCDWMLQQPILTTLTTFHVVNTVHTYTDYIIIVQYHYIYKHPVTCKQALQRYTPFHVSQPATIVLVVKFQCVIPEA
jgi:hypothetical protein